MLDASAVAIVFFVGFEVCWYLFGVRAVLAGRDMLYTKRGMGHGIRATKYAGY